MTGHVVTVDDGTPGGCVENEVVAFRDLVSAQRVYDSVVTLPSGPVNSKSTAVSVTV